MVVPKNRTARSGSKQSVGYGTYADWRYSQFSRCKQSNASSLGMVLLARCVGPLLSAVRPLLTELPPCRLSFRSSAFLSLHRALRGAYRVIRLVSLSPTPPTSFRVNMSRLYVPFLTFSGFCHWSSTMLPLWAFHPSGLRQLCSHCHDWRRSLYSRSLRYSR